VSEIEKVRKRGWVNSKQRDTQSRAGGRKGTGKRENFGGLGDNGRRKKKVIPNSGTTENLGGRGVQDVTVEGPGEEGKRWAAPSGKSRSLKEMM